MRTMILYVCLAGLLVIGGCQNTELLECQEENAKLVTQGETLQKKMDRQNESSEELVIVLFEDSKKSQDKIKDLTQEINTQSKTFKQKSAELEAEVASFKEKMSSSAKLLGVIRKQLQDLMGENAHLKEKLAQLPIKTDSDAGGN